MAATGQKATTGGLVETARFRGTSSRAMSAFTADGDFVPRLPAHPLRADATADPSFGRLIAKRRHALLQKHCISNPCIPGLRLVGA
jgi:hypothetical protein